MANVKAKKKEVVYGNTRFSENPFRESSSSNTLESNIFSASTKEGKVGVDGKWNLFSQCEGNPLQWHYAPLRLFDLLCVYPFTLSKTWRLHGQFMNQFQNIWGFDNVDYSSMIHLIKERRIRIHDFEFEFVGVFFCPYSTGSRTLFHDGIC